MNRFVNPLPSAGKGTIFIIQNRVDLRPPPGNTASIADRGNKVASNVIYYLGRAGAYRKEICHK